MTIMFPVRLISTLSLAGVLGTTAQAAGFALITNSGAGTGNAYAGAAAVAEDASTVWFNPAGMTELEGNNNFSIGAHVISTKADFSDRGSWVNPALTGGDFDAAQEALTGPNADGGQVSAVPNAYFTRRINDKWVAGVGVNVPFGLGTDYDDDWIGRYVATSSDITTININPSLAYELNDRWSIGAGLNVQYIDVELKSSIDSAAACRSIAGAANSGTLLAQCLEALPTLSNRETDSSATISGDDVSYGFNVGAIFKPTPRTKIGVSYRSKTDHDLEGEADYSVNAALQPILTGAGITRFNDADVEAIADLPAHYSLSVAHQFNERLELLADITRTEWDSFERLRITEADTGAVVSNVEQQWRNSNRYSVGMNYQYSDNLKLRAGLAYDETPIRNEVLRTSRTPGNDRTWLSLGANYRLNKQMTLDVGYSHLFLDETAIDNTSEDNGYSVRGDYDAAVDILSAQLNWTF